LLFLAIDSTLYQANFSIFTYTIPAGVNTIQNFSVAGN
jgi:hypothetical protein